MIQPHWTYQDVVHYYKAMFVRSNLKRKRRDKLPHGSYYNRGQHKRYMKVMKPYWDKITGDVDKAV